MGVSVPRPIYPGGGRLLADSVLEHLAWLPSRLSPYTLDPSTLCAPSY